MSENVVVEYYNVLERLLTGANEEARKDHIVTLLELFHQFKSQASSAVKLLPNSIRIPCLDSAYDDISTYTISRFVNSMASTTPGVRERAVFCLGVLLAAGLKHGVFSPASQASVAKTLSNLLVSISECTPGEIQHRYIAYLCGWRILFETNFLKSENAVPLISSFVNTTFAVLEKLPLALYAGDLAADLIVRLLKNVLTASAHPRICTECLADSPASLTHCLAGKMTIAQKALVKAGKQFAADNKHDADEAGTLLPLCTLLLKCVTLQLCGTTLPGSIKKPIVKVLEEFKRAMNMCVNIATTVTVRKNINVVAFWPLIFATAARLETISHKNKPWTQYFLNSLVEIGFAKDTSQGVQLECTHVYLKSLLWAKSLRILIDSKIFIPALETFNASGFIIHGLTSGALKPLRTCWYANLARPANVGHEAACVNLKLFDMLIRGRNTADSGSLFMLSVKTHTRAKFPALKSPLHIETHNAPSPLDFGGLIDQIFLNESFENSQNTSRLRKSTLNQVRQDPFPFTQKELASMFSAVNSEVQSSKKHSSNKLVATMISTLKPQKTPLLAEGPNEAAETLAPLRNMITQIRDGEVKNAASICIQMFTTLSPNAATLDAGIPKLSRPAGAGQSIFPQIRKTFGDLVKGLKLHLLDLLKASLAIGEDKKCRYTPEIAKDRLTSIFRDTAKCLTICGVMNDSRELSENEVAANQTGLQLPWALFKLLEASCGKPDLVEDDAQSLYSSFAEQLAILARIRDGQELIENFPTLDLEVPAVGGDEVLTHTENWVQTARYLKHLAPVMSLAQHLCFHHAEAAAKYVPISFYNGLWDVVLGEIHNDDNDHDNEEEDAEGDVAEARSDDDREQNVSSAIESSKDDNGEDTENGPESTTPMDSTSDAEDMCDGAEKPDSFDSDEDISINDTGAFAEFLSNSNEEELLLAEKRAKMMELKSLARDHVGRNNTDAMRVTHSQRTRAAKTLEALLSALPSRLEGFNADEVLDTLTLTAERCFSLSVACATAFELSSKGSQDGKKKAGRIVADLEGAWARRLLELWTALNKVCEKMVDSLPTKIEEPSVVFNNALVLYAQSARAAMEFVDSRLTTIGDEGWAELASSIDWLGKFNDWAAHLYNAKMTVNQACQMLQADISADQMNDEENQVLNSELKQLWSISVAPPGDLYLHPLGIRCKKCPTTKHSNTAHRSCWSVSHGNALLAYLLLNRIRNYQAKKKSPAPLKLIRAMVTVNQERLQNPLLMHTLIHELAANRSAARELMGILMKHFAAKK